jgi:hypothetical protein
MWGPPLWYSDKMTADLKEKYILQTKNYEVHSTVRVMSLFVHLKVGVSQNEQ